MASSFLSSEGRGRGRRKRKKIYLVMKSSKDFGRN